MFEQGALRIDLFLHQQGIDTTTPAGKAMFQMMMAIFPSGRRTTLRLHMSSTGGITQ
jgi:hypothetical protein